MLAEAIFCMAFAVYHEARGETDDGQMAVALVVRNRATLAQTPVCWQVFKDAQFSFTNNVRNLQTIPSGDAWDRSVFIAKIVAGGAIDITNGATHYHTIGVQPRWARGMRKIGKWGSHVFYREAA
jgi:spore germination cell wall hydrolase CwlJ-like protein